MAVSFANSGWRVPAQRIAIVRALMLGDLLCAIPAVRALRGANLDAHITLVSLQWAVELADRFTHYFDGFLRFPGFPGLPEQSVNPSEVQRFLRTAQESRFDLVLQM